MGAVDIPGSDRGVTPWDARRRRIFQRGRAAHRRRTVAHNPGQDMVLEYIRANPERVPYDQDALNACFRARRNGSTTSGTSFVRFIENRWCFRWRARDRGDPPRCAIIHFNGGSKPWSYFCDHPRQAEYQQYLRMTEWRDYVPPTEPR